MYSEANQQASGKNYGSSLGQLVGARAPEIQAQMKHKEAAIERLKQATASLAEGLCTVVAPEVPVTSGSAGMGHAVTPLVSPLGESLGRQVREIEQVCDHLESLKRRLEV